MQRGSLLAVACFESGLCLRALISQRCELGVLVTDCFLEIGLDLVALSRGVLELRLHVIPFGDRVSQVGTRRVELVPGLLELGNRIAGLLCFGRGRIELRLGPLSNRIRHLQIPLHLAELQLQSVARLGARHEVELGLVKLHLGSRLLRRQLLHGGSDPLQLSLRTGERLRTAVERHRLGRELALHRGELGFGTCELGHGTREPLLGEPELRLGLGFRTRCRSLRCVGSRALRYLAVDDALELDPDGRKLGVNFVQTFRKLFFGGGQLVRAAGCFVPGIICRFLLRLKHVRERTGVRQLVLELQRLGSKPRLLLLEHLHAVDSGGELKRALLRRLGLGTCEI